MKSHVFVNFIWVLLVSLVALFGFFKNHFSGKTELQHQVVRLRQNLESEKMRALLSEHAALDFRQQVATVLPEVLEKTRTGDRFYSVRNLASVVGVERADKKVIEIVRLQYEQARRDFRDQRYAKAADRLKLLVRDQPLGLDVIEAHFLLAESLYQLGKYQDVILVVSDMVELFPESDLTGFILLRLGQIYEQQDRMEDAQEMYRIILTSYAEPRLVQQARTNLEAIRL